MSGNTENQTSTPIPQGADPAPLLANGSFEP